MIENVSEFIDVKVAKENFLKRNYVISKEMIDNKVSGKIVIEFVVEKDGSLTNLRLLDDLGFGTGKELFQIVKLMPKWKCGF
jgi:hypothetical protein